MTSVVCTGMGMGYGVQSLGYTILHHSLLTALLITTVRERVLVVSLSLHIQRKVDDRGEYIRMIQLFTFTSGCG